MLSLLFFNLVEVPNIFSPIACALANKDGAPTEPNAELREHLLSYHQ